ncbi:MAG: DUF3108 domain-containing protein [Bacteroidetes bacterium]|nr:DUF3108 domain-containing protein [Bacteroidota bacterium]
MATLGLIHNGHMLVRNPRGDWWRIVLLWILTVALKYFASAFLVACILAPFDLDAQPSSTRPFQDGEFLRYKVRWSFIRIGTVEISQHLIPQEGCPEYFLRMRVQSAKGLPFINLHFVHEAIVSTDPIAVRQETVYSGDDPNARTSYQHFRDQDLVVVTDSVNGCLERQDTVRASGLAYEAMSLLMFARCHARSCDTVVLQTMVNSTLGLTRLCFSQQCEMLDAPAFNEELRCVRFDGTAEWVGSAFAGMSGGFIGWMSDDSGAVPIRAEVKIALGSIVLELESYERTGWTPATTALVQN